jgi:hypothetical protein
VRSTSDSLGAALRARLAHIVKRSEGAESAGLKAGLEDKASKMIVADASYETAEPTVDSQIVRLKASGADVFILFSSNKFSAQALRKSAEIGWDALRILAGASSSVGAVMKTAGFSNVQGVVSAATQKDPDDPQWKDDADVKRWREFMDKYYPSGDQQEPLRSKPPGRLPWIRRSPVNGALARFATWRTVFRPILKR